MDEETEIVYDVKGASKVSKFEILKESIFTSQGKENDTMYYSYDKSCNLISVEYVAKAEKNEYYAYDKQGNMLETCIGKSIYSYIYDTVNQLMDTESTEGKREYFYDRAGRLIYVFL